MTSASSAKTEDAEGIPISGEAVPQMASFDLALPAFLRRWNIPGASLAVMRDDRLILARGYGWANVETREPVETSSRFRTASISKPITSAAILLLVQRGRLYLDAPVFKILSDLQPFAGEQRDPRLKLITIRHLLQHSGGWDREMWGDPMWEAARSANANGADYSSDNALLIRTMMGQPLQFTPGTKAVYSNFGYILLGRIIEEVTCEPYESWVKANVLTPAGVGAMQEGKSKEAGRASGEVHYYDFPGAPLTASMKGKRTDVTRPYSCGLEAMSACSGWIASPSDYLRFLASVDGITDRTDLISLELQKEMTARPPYESKASTYYGLGWMVKPIYGGANWWHQGTLPGSSTLVARLQNGVSWVVMFNSHPEEGAEFGSAVEKVMREAIESVEEWPEGDLFEARAIG